MADQTVTMFSPDGGQKPLELWDPIPAASVASGEPVQTGNEHLNINKGNPVAGVWTCSPWESVPAPYDVHEFMIVLEGSIIIEHENGNVQTFGAGESFAMPKGMPCVWRQTEDVRKYYFIFDDPSGAESDNPAALDAIRVVVPATLPQIDAGDAAQFIGDVPTMGLESVMVDPTGQFQVGIWESTPMQRQPATIARSEIMHILEGSGSITNADGVVFNFKAGDTFLVPIGMGYQWHNTEYVKKIFCALTPS
jgi:uncharacterized cupin superfamily protein